MHEGGREVIADTSPIQYLFQTGLLDVLPSLYGQITIPEAVAHELRRGRALGVSLPDPDALQWIQVSAVSQPAPQSIPLNLGLGEREVLGLALQIPGSHVLLDDALARRQARNLGVSFSGTLGVLLEAKAAGHVPALGPVLVQLETLHFYLAPAARINILKLAGEFP